MCANEVGRAARHGIDAFDALGAHAEQPVIGYGDQFVFLGARPNCADMST